MATPQPQPANTGANIRKATEAIAEVLRMKQEFIRCHDFLTANSHKLVELLREAEPRGHLPEDALPLVDTTYWLQAIDGQSKFVSAVPGFTKEPGGKSLRSLIELYGRDRDRMLVEAEIVERQLKHQLDTFAQPDDAGFGKAIMKNMQQISAVSGWLACRRIVQGSQPAVPRAVAARHCVVQASPRITCASATHAIHP